MKNIIEIQFDGGCKGNPGNKYGSFAVFHQIESRPKHLAGKVLRQEFGYGTNNEAEFDALIAALKWTEEALEVGGFKPRDFSVSMITDSTVVAFRINRTNQSNKSEPEKRMFALAARCLQTLIKFKEYKIAFVPRERNVELFGH